MSIITDSIGLEKPKNPATCTVFKLYSLLADKDQQEALRKKYREGHYGYGQAKQALFTLILDKFAEERKLFHYYMEHLPILHRKLEQGEAKARKVALQTLKCIRTQLGY